MRRFPCIAIRFPSSASAAKHDKSPSPQKPALPRSSPSIRKTDSTPVHSPRSISSSATSAALNSSDTSSPARMPPSKTKIVQRKVILDDETDDDAFSDTPRSSSSKKKRKKPDNTDDIDEFSADDDDGESVPTFFRTINESEQAGVLSHVDWKNQFKAKRARRRTSTSDRSNPTNDHEEGDVDGTNNAASNKKRRSSSSAASGIRWITIEGKRIAMHGNRRIPGYLAMRITKNAQKNAQSKETKTRKHRDDHDHDHDTNDGLNSIFEENHSPTRAKKPKKARIDDPTSSTVKRKEKKPSATVPSTSSSTPSPSSSSASASSSSPSVPTVAKPSPKGKTPTAPANATPLSSATKQKRSPSEAQSNTLDRYLRKQ